MKGAAGFLQEEWRKELDLESRSSYCPSEAEPETFRFAPDRESFPDPGVNRECLSPKSRKIDLLKIDQSEVSQARAGLTNARLEVEQADLEVTRLRDRQEAVGVRLSEVAALIRDYEEPPPPPIENELDMMRARLEGVSRSQLEEIKSLKNPPQPVQRCLEAVWLLLYARAENDEALQSPRRLSLSLYGTVNAAIKLAVSGRRSDKIYPPKWSQVQSMLGTRGFIQSMLSYDIRSLDHKLREHINRIFSFSRGTEAEIERASRACGPLYLWLHRVMTDEPTESPAEPTKVHIPMPELLREQAALKEEDSRVEDLLEDAEDDVAKASKGLLTASRALQRFKERAS